MWGELAHSLQQGNGYVVTILVMGFLATIVFFERLIMLQFVYNIDFGKFLGNLKKMIAADDMARAINLCKNVSSTSLPRIGLRALEAAEVDPTTVRGTLDEETIDFLPAIERRLSVLPALTLLIMLVGILGTIDSLWNAFQSVDVLDTARRQATLAQGIASALNPTAMGLAFGLVLLAGHHLLRGIAASLSERLQYGVTVLYNLLAPKEVATYMPFDSGGGSGGGGGGGGGGSGGGGGGAMAGAHFETPASTAAEFESKAAAPAAAPEEAFDDVSVEDIKDEEEII